MVFTAVGTSVVEITVDGGMVWFLLSRFTTYSMSIAYTPMMAKFLAFIASEWIRDICFNFFIDVADFYFFRSCWLVES